MIGKQISVTDDLALLLRVMPPHIRSILEEHANQDVLLEVLETRDNWAHVKHSDGDTGYVRIIQVWGL